MMVNARFAAVVWSVALVPLGAASTIVGEAQPHAVQPALEDPRPWTEAFRIPHQRFTTWVGFGPDGRRILTASDDGYVRVTDADSGKPLVRLGHDGTTIFASESLPIANSAGDRRIVGGNLFGGNALVWHVTNTTAKPTVSVKHASTYSAEKTLVHAGDVRAAAITEDGERVVSVSDDGTARVWEAVTGDPIGNPMQHAAPVERVVVSSDGHRLATVTSDSTARVWETRTQRLIRTFEDTPFIGFCADGTVFTATIDGAATKQAVARQWKESSQEPMSQWTFESGAIPVALNRGTRVAVSGDCQTIAAADGSTVLLQRASRGAAPILLSADADNEVVRYIAFAPDGKTVAGAYDRLVVVWKASAP